MLSVVPCLCQQHQKFCIVFNKMVAMVAKVSLNSLNYMKFHKIFNTLAHEILFINSEDALLF